MLYKNGVSVAAKGFMETDNTSKPIPVTFPYSGKIDPQTEEYEFYTDDKEEIVPIAIGRKAMKLKITILFRSAGCSTSIPWPLY